MITAIRPSDRTAPTDERPGRFLRAAAAPRPSARERAATGAYVIDPAAVAGALLDRLVAGHALDPRGRAGARAC
jgi:hypothetical protein